MAKHAARGGCLKRLFIILLILVVLAAGALIFVKMAPTHVEQRTPPTAAPTVTARDDQPLPQETEAASVPWNVNEALPVDEWINILLMGTDASDPDAPGRTDVMIIASVNMKDGQLKLTSIMRDTYVHIEGHGNNRINTANWFGGVDLALETVNESFGMNITHYAIVDFSSFAELVEELGGVNLTITEEEMAAINASLTSARTENFDAELDQSPLTEWGENVHLTGLQTLSYSRIRKLGGDQQRTSRQRLVLGAVLEKLRTVRNPATLYQLLDTGLHYIRTSLTSAEIAALAMKVITNGLDYEELRLPAEGTYRYATIRGMDVIDPDLERNTQILYDFIYGGDS